MIVTIAGWIAIIAILAVVGQHFIRSGMKPEQYPNIKTSHDPKHGWLFRLDHDGEVMQDGFYPTEREAIAAANFEHGRREANR
jgi:hypothetical protein